MNDLEHMLTQATDEEFDAWIDCAHDGKQYVDAGPLTGEPFTRCSKCHNVIREPDDDAAEVRRVQ